MTLAIAAAPCEVRPQPVTSIHSRERESRTLSQITTEQYKFTA